MEGGKQRNITMKFRRCPERFSSPSLSKVVRGVEKKPDKGAKADPTVEVGG